MSSQSEKDKERLVQAAKMFFFQMQDISFFTKTLTDLFNSSMNTQIILKAVKEDGYVKDVFEQMLIIFKEMQFVVDAKYSRRQKEPLCSQMATAMRSVVEKSTNVKELQQSAKQMFRNIRALITVSVLNSGNILECLESSLSLLMKYPIMNLQLSDFYRKDTEEQSDASTSEESSSLVLSEVITVDTLKKLQDTLKTENTRNIIVSAADHLEQIVRTMRPILEILQRTIKGMETKISLAKNVGAYFCQKSHSNLMNFHGTLQNPLMLDRWSFGTEV
ncbi:PREDICTED: uncharacterized protein C12orf60 homolog [Condylura cristata]|uniref:uncharacterized protein C12orf60 homolog n=1 Tax=Condylura cristata TaxID=143302 RepID=UPI0003345772|nr:PREDICTED: uncharacterized protein C12orf60 homolog [Condylura cristata]